MYALNNVQWNSKLLKLLKNLKAIYFEKTKCEEMNIYGGKKTPKFEEECQEKQQEMLILHSLKKSK